jgi:hypothetical protein
VRHGRTHDNGDGVRPGVLGHVKISKVVGASGSARGSQLRVTACPSAVRRHGVVVLISCHTRYTSARAALRPTLDVWG